MCDRGRLDNGSVEGFSHDPICEAARNRRRDDPSNRIGNLDRTGLCRRTIVAGRTEAGADYSPEKAKRPREARCRGSRRCRRLADQQCREGAGEADQQDARSY